MPRPPAFRLFLGIQAVAGFASACAWTLGLVYQIEVVGLGPLQLVIVGTVLEVVCLVAQVPTGLIADLSSRRLSVIIGFALLAAGVLLSALVPTFIAVLAGSAIWGVGITCVDGALEAWAADELGEEQVGDAFTRGGQLNQVGTVVGILVAVGLASVSLTWPLFAGAVAWLGLSAVLSWRMTEHGFRPAPRSGHGPLRDMADQVRSTRAAMRGRTVLLLLFGAAGFLALGSEGFDRLGAAHFLDDVRFPQLGTPVIWFGVMSVVAMLGSIVLTEAIRRRSDVLRPASVGRILTGLEAVRVVLIIVFALTGQFWLALATWLISELLREATRPLFNTWLVAQTESATRATVISAAGMVDAAGQIVGGPPVGLVGERASIRAALVTAGLIMAPAVLFLAAAARRQRPGAPVPVLDAAGHAQSEPTQPWHAALVTEPLSEGTHPDK